MSLIASISKAVAGYSGAKKGAVYAMIFASGIIVGLLLGVSACKTTLSSTRDSTIVTHDTTTLWYPVPYVKLAAIHTATPTRSDSTSVTLDTTLTSASDTTKLVVTYDWTTKVFPIVSAIFFGTSTDTTKIIRNDTTIIRTVKETIPVLGDELMLGLGAGIMALIIAALVFAFK